jgi:hexokinase
MYLGEIMRLVLVSLVDATITLPISPTAPPKAPPALLFGGKSNAVMNEMWAIDSSFMTEVEDAWGGDRAQEEESHVGVSVAELPFDEAQLSESARKRLERVREVVVERFGYEDQDVGIWDAAVGDSPSFVRRCAESPVQVVRWVAALVARRAALLSGVPLAAILVQTGRATLRGGSAPPEAAKGEKIIVGVDGS